MKTLKNPAVLLTLCLVVASIFVYKNFFAVPSFDDLLTSDVTTQGSGKRILDLNNRLSSVTLDTSIFSQTAFEALSDFSVPLPPYTPGRPNPFDKI